MKRNMTKREEGQTLVWVAVGMVVLLLIVALALDGGHLYSERRRMQNAADAGALAGARALCLGLTQAEAEAEAVKYATTEQTRPYGHTATASTDMTNYIVTVTTTETPPLFLAGALGLGPAQVSAVSKAACGPTTRACGLFPLAFSMDLWNQVKNTCDKVFYVWSGDDDAGPDCNVYNCDIDPASPGDEIFPDTGRGWLDFGGALDNPNDPLYPIPSACLKTGCGTSEIVCWIENLNPAPVTLPKCIAGTSGVKAGAQKPIDDRAAMPYPDNIVQVPLFSSLCMSNTACKEGFYVTDFGCVKVLAWEQRQVYEKLDPKKFKTFKLVKVSVSCDKAACENQCGGTTGGGCLPGSSDVCAVSLVP